MTIDQVLEWNESNLNRINAMLLQSETVIVAHTYQIALWALAAQPECPQTLARVEQAINEIKAASCE